MEALRTNLETVVRETDVRLLEAELKRGLENMPHMEVAETLAEVLMESYWTRRSDTFAKFLEIFLRLKPEPESVGGPAGPVFRLCIFTGSFHMYECFLEEFVDIHYEGREEEKEDYLMELYTMAEQLSNYLFDNYQQSVQGMHWNGPFGSVEDREDLVILNSEDYEIMRALVENFNRIVGRRDILADLAERL